MNDNDPIVLEHEDKIKIQREILRHIYDIPKYFPKASMGENSPTITAKMVKNDDAQWIRADDAIEAVKNALRGLTDEG